MITPENYYADKTYISNSMLKDFVSYDEYGGRLLTPDKYDTFQIQGVQKVFSNPDIIQVGKIVDEYFEQGPSVLDKYDVVSRRSGDDSTQITKGMKESIDGMINIGTHFTRFMNFLKLEGTKSQVILESSILLNKKTLLDGDKKISEEDTKILIKGKPDFINYETKQIVDLKTTESLGNLMRGMFFKGSLNINADYVRQLAYYNYLAGGNFDGVIAVATPTEPAWIEVSNEILKESWEQIEKDLVDLFYFINSGIYPKTVLSNVFESIQQEEDLI